MPPVVSSFSLPTEICCAKFGPSRTNRIVGFGGSDCCVHVLPFGSGTRIAKLEGHTTRVTAVSFDRTQTRVTAGSDGGSVRLWDLETEQNIRSFGVSHRTTVTAVDNHPHGEFIATVSLDTHLRIWDVRKKSCLQAYKGNKAALHCVQFSPSGKWVATGCAQGVVRLYDLVSGNSINEFNAHTGPITSLQFHPERYYLSTGSADGSMSLWELDTFQRVFQSTPVPGRPVHQVQFPNLEVDVVVASEKLLRRYSHEYMSDRLAKHVEAPWTCCSDMVTSQGGEVLGVEFVGSTVNFSRVVLDATAAAGGSSQPNVKAAPVGPKPTASPPTVSPSRNSAPPAPQPKTAADKPRGGQPMVFQMNERQQQALVQRVSTPPERRTSIPMFPGAAPAAPKDENGVVDDLLEACGPVRAIMQRRITHTRMIRTMWSTDPRGAMRHVMQVLNTDTDPMAVSDFLGAMQHQRMKEKISLELLVEFLPIVVASLALKHDPVLLGALRIARSFHSKFRVKLDEGLAAMRYMGNGVDLAMEERIKKYSQVQSLFDDVARAATTLCVRGDSVGEESRGLLTEFQGVR